jgi:hypothetical protein
VDVLVGVDVVEHQARVLQAVDLRRELAPHILRIDAARRHPRQEHPPGRSQPAPTVHQRGHLSGAEQGRVLPHRGQVGAHPDAGCVAKRRRGGSEPRRQDQRRRAGHDAVAVGPEDGP